MDQPLGAAVGNALEVIEARATVRGEGPPDFTELVLDACARLLELSDLGVNFGEGFTMAERRDRRTASAEAMWCRWIEAQGGTPDESALRARAGRARGDGAARRARSTHLGAIAVGNAALHLGAGRRTKTDEIDHAVGVVCHAKRGDAVEAGEVLAEVHARDDAGAADGRRRGAGRVRARRRAAVGAADPARGAQPLISGGPESRARGGPAPDRAADRRSGSAAHEPSSQGRPRRVTTSAAVQPTSAPAITSLG